MDKYMCFQNIAAPKYTVHPAAGNACSYLCSTRKERVQTMYTLYKTIWWDPTDISLCSPSQSV